MLDAQSREMTHYFDSIAVRMGLDILSGVSIFKIRHDNERLVIQDVRPKKLFNR
jgi:hypothetical protein